MQAMPVCPHKTHNSNRAFHFFDLEVSVDALVARREREKPLIAGRSI